MVRSSIEKRSGTSVSRLEMARAVHGRRRSVEVRVPASTANLGSGFDCFGLALQLHLTVRATVVPEADERCRIRSRGEDGSALLPRTAEKNLIVRAMRFAAERQGLTLPPMRLAVHNGIPLASGLGSSAAAIVAGISLCALISGSQIPDETALGYATELEGHADNVAAALHGGLVITCVIPSGGVLALKKPWPLEIRVVVVTPRVTVETVHARAVLPPAVSRADAVHNLQRAALFTAALEQGRHDLLWEAMQDRLHQPHRQGLVPGLAEALATPRLPGLLGVSLSGAGPSVLAFAQSHLEQIGEAIAEPFRKHGIQTTVRNLAVDEHGRQTTDSSRGQAGSAEMGQVSGPGQGG